MILTPLPAPARNVHPLRSDYVEVCWTPVVGSTAVALLRLLPAVVEDRAERRERNER
mgnify:CR=1 FL=1